MTDAQQTSWNQLFVLYSEPAWDSLFRFSLSLCKNDSEAEDLTQQTLMKSMQALPNFFSHNYSALTPEEAARAAERQGLTELRAHMLNWMLKICKNTFLDSRNRASRKLSHITLDDWEQSADDSDASNSLRQPDFHDSVSAETDLKKAEDAFFAVALDDDWKEKFEDLNARQRSIVFLAAEDYSYKEIAQLLEIPIGTVMSTLSRALSKLKKKAEN